MVLLPPSDNFFTDLLSSQAISTGCFPSFLPYAINQFLCSWRMWSSCATPRLECIQASLIAGVVRHEKRGPRGWPCHQNALPPASLTHRGHGFRLHTSCEMSPISGWSSKPEHPLDSIHQMAHATYRCSPTTSFPLTVPCLDTPLAYLAAAGMLRGLGDEPSPHAGFSRPVRHRRAVHEPAGERERKREEREM